MECWKFAEIKNEQQGKKVMGGLYYHRYKHIWLVSVGKRQYV